MSNSDFDSDGFESAEDNENNEKESPKKSKGIPIKNDEVTANTDISDKFKALEVDNDENSDWGWDDDQDDNFNFDTKPKVGAIVSAPNSEADKQNSFETESVVKPYENQLDQPVHIQPGNSNPAWSPWTGMVSFLSSASVGVASFTSQVSSVIESNIGIPNPEEFASQQGKSPVNADEVKEPLEAALSEEANKQKNDEKLLTLGSFVSNVTSISNRVITGGLDTLEGIGKKTMTILQENDAGLISKRKLLGLDNSKPVLSQVLREAKEKSEESEKSLKLTQKNAYRKQLHFETLFDDYHGLVHLEALEMLSKQASFKLQALLMPLSGIALQELQQTMNSVNELCELNEFDQEDSPGHLYNIDELEEKLKTATEDFDIPIDFIDILNTWKENVDWLENVTETHEPQQIHDRALKCLAKTSALAINKYHKLAELLLIKDHHSTVNESDCLLQLTNSFCWHLSGIATQFSGKLTNAPITNSDIQTNSLITNIFLESSKSTSYVQNAFQLFIPILQVGAV